MGNESEAWTMRGMDWDDPFRIRSWRELIGWVNEVGFRRRTNKKGAEYGWPISVYSTPETLWSYDHISSAYHIDPAESWALIREQVRKHFPNAGEGELDMVLGK